VTKKNTTKGTAVAVTHVLMVVDMSGSMFALANDVRGGLNGYIANLKNDGNYYRMTITLFDTEFIPLVVDASLAEVPELTETNYYPRGSTALYDAIGHTLGGFQSKHGTLGKNERALVVIQTDGLENSSRDFSKDQVRKLIEDREQTDRWGFMYMGAGPSAWAEADKIGLGKFSSSTRQDSGGTRALYRGMASATRSYATGSSVGETVAVVTTTPGVVDQEATAAGKADQYAGKHRDADEEEASS